MEAVDEYCGFAGGYTSKLLAPSTMRCFGPMSLDAMLSALGLTLIAVEDPRATERARQRLKRRTFAAYEPPPIVLRFSRAHYRRMARARMQKVSPKRRSEIARQAAKKRWSRPRITEITPGHEKGPTGVSSRAKSGKRAPRRKGPQPDRKTHPDIVV
jgi:hypothetical protein